MAAIDDVGKLIATPMLTPKSADMTAALGLYRACLLLRLAAARSPRPGSATSGKWAAGFWLGLAQCRPGRCTRLGGRLQPVTHHPNRCSHEDVTAACGL